MGERELLLRYNYVIYNEFKRCTLFSAYGGFSAVLY